MGRKIFLVFFLLAVMVLPVQAKDAGQLQAPVHFKSFLEIFTYIAGDNEYEDNPEIILKLAADSRIEYISDAAIETAVITANYIDRSKVEKEVHFVNQIRGASGNGPFYVFHIKDGGGLDLVGVLWGNDYSRTMYQGKEAFETTWHMAASKYTLTTYAWNGKVFEQVSSESVVEAEDR